MIAALGVWGTATAWPDLIVAATMGTLFLSSSVQILRQAWYEYQVEAGAADAFRDAHASQMRRAAWTIFADRNRHIGRRDKDVD
jgi:hypothetical protein